MAIEIHNLQNILDVDFDRICEAVELSAGAKDPDIFISIVSDAEIRRVNREHLNRDNPTDVIAFDYQDEENVLTGEVIVSAETALSAARERELDPFAELILYMIHGVLHIIGYDDADPEGAAEMQRKQGSIMKKMGFSEGFHQ